MSKATTTKKPAVSRKAGSFTIAQPVLSEMLGAAAKACVGRSTIPAVTCVRVKFGGEGLCVEATNFETWVRVATKNFEPDGATTVLIPCQAFYSVISGTPKDQDIELSVTDKRIQVKTATAKYHFGLLPVEEWPEITWSDKAPAIVILAKQFKDMVKFIMPAVSTDDTRYYLKGIHLKVTDKDQLRAAGCDGHRASLMLTDFTGKSKVGTEGILMSREFANLSLDMFDRFLSDNSPIDLTLTSSKVRIEMETDDYEASLIGKLIDGQFPDMDRLIPYKRNSLAITMNREEVIAIIKRLAIMADMTRDLPIHFEFSADDGLTMRAKGEIGEAEERIATTNSGAGKTCMAVSKMLPIIQSFDSKNISVFIPADGEDAVAPIVFAESDAAISHDSPKFAIVMPMRG